MAASKKKAAKSTAKKSAGKPAKKSAGKPVKKSAGKPAKKTPPASAKASAKSAGSKSTAAKPASTKPAASAKTPSDGGLLRGLPLVEKALAMIENGSPKASDEIESMTLGGRPLTPALRRWLEVDDLDLGEPQSFLEMLKEEFDEGTASLFPEVAEVLTEPVVLLETGSDSRRFIYLGKTDSHGELPVFTVDTDDTPFVCLNGPLDVWLAQQAGLLEEEEYYGKLPAEYEPARREQAKLNFGGNIEFAENQFNKTLSG